MQIPGILFLGGKEYEAGIRSTKKVDYIWICPDLRDKNARKVSLVQAFTNEGFQKNQTVNLLIDGKRITVQPLNDAIERNKPIVNE